MSAILSGVGESGPIPLNPTWPKPSLKTEAEALAIAGDSLGNQRRKWRWAMFKASEVKNNSLFALPDDGFLYSLFF